uniref:Ribonuclease H1 n=1 Tax=Xenopus tropicalis TaxID=8364 RepID=A0A803JPR3_XENTR
MLKEECKEQVDRYPNASFKKLPTHSEARNYVRSHETSSPYSSAGRSAQVYTDGCCSRNGQYGANGGIGVYWGPGDSRNVSAKLKGRQTNQRAEIEAACTAVEQARDDNITSLNINTDSRFTIKGMTQWVPRWKENGWKTIDGRDVINKQDFQKLDKACENMDIKWNYVPGHSGSVGNDRADQLAKAGSRK